MKARPTTPWMPSFTLWRLTLPSKWRLMGASNLAEAVATFKARITRCLGVEATRGLARLHLPISLMFRESLLL